MKLDTDTLRKLRSRFGSRSGIDGDGRAAVRLSRRLSRRAFVKWLHSGATHQAFWASDVT